MKIKEIVKEMSFDEAYEYLQDRDIGNWDNVNSEDTIREYCKEMIDKGVHISHILEAIDNTPSSKELYCIWLGNSMETPTPINNIKDLLEALGVDEE